MDTESFFINLNYYGLKTTLNLTLLVTIYIPLYRESKITIITYILEFLGWLSEQGAKLISKSEVKTRFIQKLYVQAAILIIWFSKFGNNFLKNMLNQIE